MRLAGSLTSGYPYSLSLGEPPAVQHSKISLAIGALLSSIVLSGCSHTTKNPDLPVGDAAYAIIPPDVADPDEYYVRPLDTLSIVVFGEPDLSQTDLLVSEAGKIQLPLIGSVSVAGKDVTTLSNEIASSLGSRYLVNPQVAVSVKTIAPRYASVEGEVAKPGVYEINKDASLLSTIARAESPTRTARLDEIVVFRKIDGKQLVARFNLKDIRTGVSPDPHIRDGDVVMVGFSTTRGLMEDVLRAAPLFNAWAVLNR